MSHEAPPDVAADWFAAMRRGDFEAAWRATDRIELPRRAAQRAPGFRKRPEHLCWDGTPPQGRAVMVRCEHGLGDTLQFMRFVPLLGARALHFMVQPPLVPLLAGAPGLGQVQDWWALQELPPHEVDIEVMELAYALRITLADLPAPYPHLRGKLECAARNPAWAELRGDPGAPGLRVALLWASSDWDASRSIPLPTLAPLFALPGLRWFSLQQGAPAADPQLDGLPVVRLSERTQAIADAAVAMCAMDLVISIDGMPAHLAATLGVPTWVLLKHQADWRWMQERADSPWYPGMRLFRQRREGDWAGVVEQVAEALRGRVS